MVSESGAVDHLEEKAVKGTVKDCDKSLARRRVSPASLSESVMIEKVAILESLLPNRAETYVKTYEYGRNLRQYHWVVEMTIVSRL